MPVCAVELCCVLAFETKAFSVLDGAWLAP